MYVLSFVSSKCREASEKRKTGGQTFRSVLDSERRVRIREYTLVRVVVVKTMTLVLEKFHFI